MAYETQIVSPMTVTYTPVSIEELFTNEALNRGSETLKNSINDTLANIVLRLNGIASDITVNINETIITDWVHFQELKNLINDIEHQLAELGNTFASSDSVLASITQITNLITQIQTSNEEVISVLNLLVDVINGLPIYIRRNVLVNMQDGIYNYVYNAENIPTGIYLVSANVIDAPDKQVDIRDVTENGFKLHIRSNGTRFTLCSINCLVTPVNVVVTLSKERNTIGNFFGLWADDTSTIEITEESLILTNLVDDFAVTVAPRTGINTYQIGNITCRIISVNDNILNVNITTDGQTVNKNYTSISQVIIPSIVGIWGDDTSTIEITENSLIITKLIDDFAVTVAPKTGVNTYQSGDITYQVVNANLNTLDISVTRVNEQPASYNYVSSEQLDVSVLVGVWVNTNTTFVSGSIRSIEITDDYWLKITKWVTPTTVEPLPMVQGMANKVIAVNDGTNTYTVSLVSNNAIKVAFNGTMINTFAKATATTRRSYCSYYHKTGIITTIAGNGINWDVGDNGLATAASLSRPYDVAVDHDYIYIADTSNGSIRKVNKHTNIITKMSGSSPLDPRSIDVDGNGSVYIADSYFSKIFKLTDTGSLLVVAGTGTRGYSGDGGPATSAMIYEPQGIAVDMVDRVYIADTFNYRVRIIEGGNIYTIAGTGVSGFGGDGGSAKYALLNRPYGVAVDIFGNVYIADTFNNRIRKVTVHTGKITTIAGTGVSGYSGDGGPATSAQLNYPQDVAVDYDGNVYIADGSNYRIRKIDYLTQQISTVAGIGMMGYVADNVPANSTKISECLGIHVDNQCNIYIADSYNNRIRQIS